MPTYTDMTRCDGCGECVDICPSDIMHIDPIYRRSYNIEPNFCWECYSCVKACPQNAIDVRGYADFAPLGPDASKDQRFAPVGGVVALGSARGRLGSRQMAGGLQHDRLLEPRRSPIRLQTRG